MTMSWIYPFEYSEDKDCFVVQEQTQEEGKGQVQNENGPTPWCRCAKRAKQSMDKNKEEKLPLPGDVVLYVEYKRNGSSPLATMSWQHDASGEV